MQPIGILGGSFDPVHRGHLQLAQDADRQFNFAEIRFVPLNIPAHRAASVASPDQRQTMLEIAIENHDKYRVDSSELESPAISYTIETLQRLRQTFVSQPLCLIMGRDAFNRFDRWHEWRSILDLAHLLIADRQGEDEENCSTTLKTWIESHRTEDMNEVCNKPAGSLYFFRMQGCDISSSEVRARLERREDISRLLPDNIYAYIQQRHLYQGT